MKDNYQISLEDVEYQEKLSKLQVKYAYVDESGSFGFDFDKEGTSKYYILTAVIIDSEKVEDFHKAVQEIKKQCGLAKTEMKSKNMPDGQRARIMNMLLPLEFRLAILVVDKQQILEGTPLTAYKATFIKHINGMLYDMLYNVYPKIKIWMDETGWPEFQESFKKYVRNRQKLLNVFNEYDFELLNSKDEILIQVSDVIGGSIAKHFLDHDVPNYLEMVRGKLVIYQEFPNTYEPYWGNAKAENYQYDESIYIMAIKKARDYIEMNKKDKSDNVRSRIAILQYLTFYVNNVSATKYVYADELRKVVHQTIGRTIRKDDLFRKIIAPLRDEGIILSSCSHGYKIPISVADIVTYLNQQTSIVGPILHRMGICRNMIKAGTDNNLDVFNDPAFAKYIKYFE